MKWLAQVINCKLTQKALSISIKIGQVVDHKRKKTSEIIRQIEKWLVICYT